MPRLTSLQPRVSQLKPLVQSLNRASSPQRLDQTKGGQAAQRRARILARDPLCKPCERQGTVRASREVDHRIPLVDGGSDSDENLQGICPECHKAKTAAEVKARGGHGWEGSRR